MTPEERAESRKICEAAGRGPVAWQKFGKEWRLVGQYGMRPILLSVGRVGNQRQLRLRDADRDLLIPFDPEHPDAKRIAHSYTTLPVVLDALDAAEAKVERLQAIVDCCAAECPPNESLEVNERVALMKSDLQAKIHQLNRVVEHLRGKVAEAAKEST